MSKYTQLQLPFATVDGSSLFLWSWDRRLRQATLQRQFSCDKQITALTWTARGFLAYGGEDRRVHLYRRTNEPGDSILYDRPITALAAAPDDEVLAVASGSTISFLRATSSGLAPWSSGWATEHWSRTLVWSRGGLLAAGDQHGHIHIWDVATGWLQETLRLGFPVEALAWSPRTDILAIGGGSPWGTGLIFLWSVALGRWWSGTYEGHRGTVTALTWSPDGTRLCSGSRDGSWYLWRVPAEGASSQKGRCLMIQSGFEACTSLAWSPDGEIIASGEERGGLRMWEAATGVLLTVPRAPDPATGIGGPVSWMPLPW